MYVCRMYPDAKIQEAIIAAANIFEEKAARMVGEYREKIKKLIPTKRLIQQDIMV